MKVSLEVTINGKGTMNDKFNATGPEGLLGGMHKCFSLMWLWLQIALHTTSRWYFSCTLFNHADNVAHKKFAIELRVFSSITTAAMFLFFSSSKMHYTNISTCCMRVLTWTWRHNEVLRRDPPILPHTAVWRWITDIKLALFVYYIAILIENITVRLKGVVKYKQQRERAVWLVFL